MSSLWGQKLRVDLSSPMSSKSLEELLELLYQSTDTVEKLASEMDMFVQDHEIEPSETDKVDARVIYWIYLRWKLGGHGTESALSRVEFSRQMSKRFKRGKDKERYFRIKKNQFRLSEDEREELQNDLQLERRHQKWLRNRRKKEM